jgi:hypothetical protein
MGQWLLLHRDPSIVRGMPQTITSHHACSLHTHSYQLNTQAEVKDMFAHQTPLSVHL